MVAAPAYAEPSLPWRALGFEPWKGGEILYVFEADGFIVRLRQGHLATLAGVMSLDPDATRWRRMFPHPSSAGRLDVPSIAGFLMAECRAAQRRREAAAKAAEAASASPRESSEPTKD